MLKISLEKPTKLKKTRNLLQTIGILFIGVFIVMYLQIKKQDETTRQLFESFATIQGIILEDNKLISESEKQKFKNLCQNLTKYNQEVDEKEKAFCEFILSRE